MQGTHTSFHTDVCIVNYDDLRAMKRRLTAVWLLIIWKVEETALPKVQFL